LERIALGIVEEPVLLSTKKTKGRSDGAENIIPATALGVLKKKPTLEVVEELELEDAEPEEATSIINTAEVQELARRSKRDEDEEHETSVIDLNQYSALTRASKPGAPLPPPDRMKTDPDMRAVKIPQVKPVGSGDVS